ncbi:MULTISPECIES: DUF47 domain-containing protein [Ureibacillus]|jgi:uncharacterized protein|uniref:DUF47 domain-containing protein n=1 Tax=Ureibacillus thermosphaericus TaxID=51173 RepID=A0A840PZZ8_URETH|nr:DUF47 family protein [Ureibacillus thermosphaericus]MBB5148396.1 hypothetical protein [Ureibacillus thermosphaericus]NKZ31272.1 DUF47 domain-containing protein [Ureibacillus thermosphaericus]
MFNPKKSDPFFVSLHKIAENMRDAVHFANDFNIDSIADLKELSIKVKKFETDGDNLIHELIVMLNKSFMTPIEREDILALAIKMDDVLDGIEQCFAHLEMFSIPELDESMRTFLKYITRSADEIVSAIDLLNKKDLTSMRNHIILIKDYERECDEVSRSSIKQLFLNEKDPIRLIKYKDIYNQLEDIADHCQDVANTLETIIMRNA